MSGTPKPGGKTDDPESFEVPPVPDEDGPHDVPDDKVIEKTLPTIPMPNGGDSADSPRQDKPAASGLIR